MKKLIIVAAALIFTSARPQYVKSHRLITLIVMINNGKMLEPEETAGGYVAVAASCN